jgi:hypothetical protein
MITAVTSASTITTAASPPTPAAGIGAPYANRSLRPSLATITTRA